MFQFPKFCPLKMDEIPTLQIEVVMYSLWYHSFDIIDFFAISPLPHVHLHHDDDYFKCFAQWAFSWLSRSSYHWFSWRIPCSILQKVKSVFIYQNVSSQDNTINPSLPMASHQIFLCNQTMMMHDTNHMIFISFEEFVHEKNVIVLCGYSVFNTVISFLGET